MHAASYLVTTQTHESNTLIDDGKVVKVAVKNLMGLCLNEVVVTRFAFGIPFLSLFGCSVHFALVSSELITVSHKAHHRIWTFNITFKIFNHIVAPQM